MRYREQYGHLPMNHSLQSLDRTFGIIACIVLHFLQWQCLLLHTWRIEAEVKEVYTVLDESLDSMKSFLNSLYSQLLKIKISTIIQ
jgi:hypothetical protein